jgi:membrane protease YdiL (CAAX protease family)
VLIGAYPVVLGLLGVSRGGHGPALTRSTKGLLITCGIQLGIFGLVFGLGWLASRASREDLLLRWRPGWWAAPLGVIYSIALRFGVGLVATFVFLILVSTRIVSLDQAQSFAQANRPDVAALVDTAALHHDPAYFWLTLTFVSFVVAGFREEIWRAAFLAGLKNLWPNSFQSPPGRIAAVAVASVVFGLGHLALGPLGVASATLLGFGLGFIMVLHRSIWPAVIAHGMFDATTFALLPWAMEKLQQLPS